MKQYMDVTGDNSTLDYKLTQAKQALVNRYARLEKLNQRYFKDYLVDSSSIAAVLFADRSAGVMAEAIKSGVPQCTKTDSPRLWTLPTMGSSTGV